MGTLLINDILELAPVFTLEDEELSDYAIFYKTLAEGMDDMITSINSNLDPVTKVLELLIYMIDLTTAEDFDVNQALLDIRDVMRNVYMKLNVYPLDRSSVITGVKATNDHTKRYINADLTDFVNNEVWPGGCVPYEWALASEDAGEDISGWNVCEPS